MRGTPGGGAYSPGRVGSFHIFSIHSAFIHSAHRPAASAEAQQAQQAQQPQQAPPPTSRNAPPPPPADNHPTLQLSADPELPCVYDTFGGSLAALNGHAAVITTPGIAVPLAEEVVEAVRRAAAKHDCGKLGRGGNRFVAEDYCVRALIEEKDPLLGPFVERLRAAMEAAGTSSRNTTDQAGTSASAASAASADAQPKIRVPVGTDWWVSVYPDGAGLRLHLHGAGRAHRTFGGKGNKGTQRDVVRKYHTLQVGCRLGAGTSELAWQVGNGPRAAVTLRHGDFWIMDRVAAGEVAYRAIELKTDADPDSRIRHGVPTTTSLALTLMIKVEVQAETAEDAVKLLSQHLQPKEGDGSGSGDGSLQVRVVGSSDFPAEAILPQVPDGLPLGEFYGLVSFYRHMRVAGTRELWQKLSHDGRQPFAFTHPATLRTAFSYWVTTATMQKRRSCEACSRKSRRRR